MPRTFISFLSCLNLACDQRMFHFVVQKTGTVAASKTLSAAAAVLFNARPAASANRSMGSLCPRERERREKGQSTREGREGSFDKMDNSLRAGWSMAAITSGEKHVCTNLSPFSPSLLSQPTEVLKPKGKKGRGISKFPASGINKHEIGMNRPHLRPICCLKGGWL